MLELIFPQDGHVVPTATITVVIVGLVVLAGIDVWRREVEDYATAGLLLVAIAGVAIEGIAPAQWIGAILASAIAFMVYLSLGQRGVMGGGDVKLSLVPAFVLGASNPIIGIWWIAGAIVIQQLFFYINARVQKAPEPFPHVPAMALATLVATVAFPASI
jgi:prepilin signal peptidase PulO-like enzyme (type II secretory pathway)